MWPLGEGLKGRGEAGRGAEKNVELSKSQLKKVLLYFLMKSGLGMKQS